MIYQFCFRSKWLAIAFVAGLLGFASIHDHRASRLLTLMLNCNYRYDRILGSSIFNDLIHIGNIPIELGRLRNAKSRGSAAAVSVHVFVESLCVDSKLFFDQQLTPAFEILGPTVMNIAVVSFGNARISSEELTCQHGKGKCYQLVEVKRRDAHRCNRITLLNTITISLTESDHIILHCKLSLFRPSRVRRQLVRAMCH